MASFASSPTTGGARKHAWTKNTMDDNNTQIDDKDSENPTDTKNCNTRSSSNQEESNPTSDKPDLGFSNELPTRFPQVACH